MTTSKDEAALTVFAQGLSDVGLVRENNEDCFLLLDLTTGTEMQSSAQSPQIIGPQGVLLLVADGMGGAEAGEVASRMAVDEIAQRMASYARRRRALTRQTFVDALKDAIVQANTQLYQASRKDAQRQGMGTTLTAAAIHDGAVFFAQVGDSRGYVLRGQILARMTRDQSLVAELEEAGEVDAARLADYPFKNVLLQALGTASRVTIPVTCTELRRGDWLLLCSDGLTNMVKEEEIGDILRGATEAAAACAALIAAANSNGGQDNATVVTAHVAGAMLPVPEAGEEPVAQEFVSRWWRRFLP